MSKARSLFFTDKERRIAESCGRELIETILGQEILLYKISSKKTTAHPLYGEAKRKEFDGPYTIKGRMFRDDLDVYMEGGLRKQSKMDVRFMVYLKALEELGIDIDVGDYFNDRGRWFEIFDTGYGHREKDYPVDDRFYIIVFATQVTNDVFEGR